VLKKLIEQHRAFALGSRGDAFQTLARAIVGQQISVKAAQSVWDRFVAAHSAVTPAVVALSRIEHLRGCGLSGQKSGYILDLASRFHLEQLQPERWKRLEDEALLARPDVFPVADLGLQKAMQLHYNRGRKLTPARMQRIGAAWAPWRSVATWYLWRSLDPIPVEY
jgi:DNA-3-methyladenine glycosylase II